MIFLNSLLALGALAFTVPLAIHLLFRNRFEIIDWGAMRFLESVVRVNRRRLQLRNILLLILRCAIPILLALCLARPILTGWQSLPGDEPVSMVMALDVSDSLAAKSDTTPTRFEQLIKTAERIVADLPRGSDVAIVTSNSVAGVEASGGDPKPTSTDPQAALGMLRGLQIGGASLSLDNLLSESLRQASNGATERRQIVLLTDDAATDFGTEQMDALESIGKRRSAQTPAPTIAWVSGWDDEIPTATNRRITRLEPEPSTAAVGQKVTWTVEARIDGDVPVTTTADVRVDGEKVQSETLAFRNGIARATFTTTFENAGHHAIEVALKADDNFSPDDRLRSDFLTLSPIDVFLIDGNPSEKPLEGDTDFLSIALSPFSLSGNKAVDLFRTTKVSLRKLLEQKMTPKIVVLADVGTIPKDEATWLTEFVTKRGGNLVIFAGKQTDAASYEEQLIGDDGKSLLPMTWGDIVVDDADNAGAKIDETRLTYPPLVAFMTEAKGTLQAVDTTRHRKLIPIEEKNANVVLRLDNGDPLIVVSQVGSTNGQVMQFATTANDQWTSLPRRLAFVPLMQRLFMHLAIGQSSTAVRVAGEPIIIEAKSGNWTVTTPRGESKITKPVDGTLRFSQTDAAGIYRLQSDDDQIAFASVNVPESELKRIVAEPSTMEDAAKRIGAVRYNSIDAFQQDDSVRRFGRGVWRYLLLGLLAAMIAEPFLQQRGAKVTS